ncbi:hypothetical protein [Acinetobacter sp. YH01009]|uniref:hypothetical protein n=1 Tax=Acinetobacter sp. YH01009 TaxID=2601025 RepID=UPI0015D3B6DA|nr:hypothetical protein [Acinetobacter sp. YH01009]
MKINAKIRITKKLFDHGYVVVPVGEADFKSALLLLNIQKKDDIFLISKNIIDGEIGGEFDLVDKNGKAQLFLKDLNYISLFQNTPQLDETPFRLKENKNRYLAKTGSVAIGDLGLYKKKNIKILSVGKPFILTQKLSDIPEWLFEKLNNTEVSWVYFEFIETLKETSLDLKNQIISCIQYFKQHGEKTRRKALIQAESPGNVNLQRYCDLRRIDPDLKVVFVISENYIWLLEQNRNDPLPNVKLNNINFGGWILSKTSNEHLIVKLKSCDGLLKKSPEIYSS